MKRFFVLLFLICSVNVFSQQNLLPLSSYYKDHLFSSTQRMESYKGNGFFPLSEGEYDLHYKIADTSKQYNNFSHILFQKHLLEFKGDNYFLTISPVFDFALGKDISDTTNRRLFQNTRGFTIEGDLFKNFSFATTFYENQSRNVTYQSNYYANLGERYVNHGDSTYYAANAVIPGSGRTKPFKNDGFDYAFAHGNIQYKVLKQLTLSAGNSPHFVGNGYRSLLLSDNSFLMPYYQINYRFLPKWEFVYMRSKLLNLNRRPANSTPEAYYEPKGYAVNYLSYQVTKNLSLAFFEGIIYSRGDSVTSRSSNPLYYNPIPVLSSLATKSMETNSIFGLNIGYTILEKNRLYSQIAWNPKSNGYGAQLGVRFSELFKVPNFFVQLEGNFVSNDLYRSVNPRLNYSHYNLPLAHSKGENFTEFLLRVSYEVKRFYIDNKSVSFLLNNFSQTALLPIYQTETYESGIIFNNELELGYRFNRKLNFVVFVNHLLRTESNNTNSLTNALSVGIRTGLHTRYTDF